MRPSYRKALILLAGLLLATFCWMGSGTLFRGMNSTVLEDGDGELLSAHIAPDGQWRFPEGDSIPAKFRICLLEFEDRNFYFHNGVDLSAIARAIYLNFSSGRIRSGGSTLTMQLARIALGNKE